MSLSLNPLQDLGPRLYNLFSCSAEISNAHKYKNIKKFGLFSSPEPKAPGELIV